MNNKEGHDLPKPLAIPDDLYYVVRQLVDAWNEKRIISIQTKDLKLTPPDPIMKSIRSK